MLPGYSPESYYPEDGRERGWGRERRKKGVNVKEGWGETDKQTSMKGEAVIYTGIFLPGGGGGDDGWSYPFSPHSHNYVHLLFY